MSGNVNTYPKTVNLESSIPVNSQMKRVVKSNCSNGSTPKCIKKSYNIPIAGAQYNNNWCKLNGMTIHQTCKGPVIHYGDANSSYSACVLKYSGISGTGGNCIIHTPYTVTAYIYNKTQGTTQQPKVGTNRGRTAHFINPSAAGMSCPANASLQPECRAFAATFVDKNDVSVVIPFTSQCF